MARALTRHQHLDPHRKYLLRKRLLRWAQKGPVYLPFCGDGDIAVGGQKNVLAHEHYPFPGVYADRFIYGADLDPDRVAKAQKRIVHGEIRTADCDYWPFGDLETDPLAIGDFDAWAEPYPAFRSFWEYAELASRLVVFFTDAHRMGIAVDGTFIHPDGSKQTLDTLLEKRRIYNFYLVKHIFPWFEDHIRPYHVLEKAWYTRGMLTYWGAAIERKERSDG